jgi:hypothetical protein
MAAASPRASLHVKEIHRLMRNIRQIAKQSRLMAKESREIREDSQLRWNDALRRMRRFYRPASSEDPLQWWIDDWERHVAEDSLVLDP